MALSRRFVIFCLIVIWGFGGLRAAEKEEPARVTAVWLDGRRAVGDLFIADSKGNPQKLTVGVSGRGKPIDLPSTSGAVVLLRKAAATPAAGGTSAYETAGQVTLPEGKPRKVILLLASSGKGGAPLIVRGVALNDDLETFPVHSVRFANFLGGELACKVGDSVKAVPPGSSSSWSYPVLAKADSKVIPVFPLALARSDRNGKAELIYNGRIEAWGNSRALVAVFPGPTPADDPVVRTIFDIIPPAPPSAAATPRS